MEGHQPESKPLTPNTTADSVKAAQDTMRAKGMIIGRTFKPYTDWCRISIGTPDEMKACVAALPEALRA